MTAQWKIPKLDRTKRLNDLERLQQRVAELEAKLKTVGDERRFYRQQNENMSVRLREVYDERVLFQALLQEEVMVPTKDGFKLLTGAELREYCRELHERNRKGPFGASVLEMLNLQFDLAYKTYYAHVNTKNDTWTVVKFLL